MSCCLAAPPPLTPGGLALLADYYGAPSGSAQRSGAAFDTWDSTGTQQRDLDRFTCRCGTGSGPSGRRSAAAARPAWSLMGALHQLPGVGATKASKLFARKRPRLRPIYDSVVAEVMDTRQQHWEPTGQASGEQRTVASAPAVAARPSRPAPAGQCLACVGRGRLDGGQEGRGPTGAGTGGGSALGTGRLGVRRAGAAGRATANKGTSTGSSRRAAGRLRCPRAATLARRPTRAVRACWRPS